MWLSVKPEGASTGMDFYAEFEPYSEGKTGIRGMEVSLDVATLQQVMCSQTCSTAWAAFIASLLGVRADARSAVVMQRAACTWGLC